MMSPKTPSPRRSKHQQSAQLTCSCKAGYCSAVDCFACRKCCLSHNSRLKIGKEKRAIGRPKLNDQRQKPVANTDRNDATTGLQRAAKADVNYAGLLTPLTTPKKAAPVSITKLLELLGYDDQTAARLTKHLPPRNLRSETTFWDQGQEGDDDPAHVSQRLAVMRLYHELLFSVATSVCASEEAASSSLVAFAMWLSPDASKPSHQAVVRSCLRAIATAKKGSTERRLVRATLCGTFKRQDLDTLSADIPEHKIGHSTYHAARHDFDRLLQGDQIPKVTWTRKRFNTEAVTRAIGFILAYENVAYVSWGTKKIKLHGASHDVPSILRKRPTSVIYRQYFDRFSTDRVSRPSFYRLCSTLTNGEVLPRTSVDYVTGFLVYDALDTLREIMMVVSPRTAQGINQKLDVIQAWLKYGHAALRDGVDLSGGCPRHDVVYGLSTPCPETPVQPRTACCPQCTSLHRFFAHIFALIRSADIDQSAMQVARGIYNKLELFMGHRLRVVNQQREIAKMIDEAKSQCEEKGSTDLAVVLIDFKMKAEPVYFKEKTADHYGKRGMSWHGVLIRSWEMHQESEDTVPFIRETIVYYDQLSSSDNKQDKGAVLSLLEATMMAIRRSMPHIRRIIVQSDNASCYQNMCIILMLPIIGFFNGIRVERYEHTDTQDGKSPLDGHFGQAQRKVRRFVKQGNNCVTPTQYVIALGADGGLPNCVAELVEYARQVLTRLLERIAPLETQLSKLIKRPNDVFYECPDRTDLETDFDVGSCPDFFLRSFAYSGIGSGVYVRVSLQKQTCTKLSDDREEHGLDDDGLTDDNETERDAIGRSAVAQNHDCLDGNDADEEEVEQTTSAPLANNKGGVTGVTIMKTAQLIRRARKWRFGQNALRALKPQQHDEGPEDRDMVAFAKTQLLSLCGSSELGVVTAPNIGASLAVIADDLAVSPCSDDLPALEEGWARRPRNGHMYGEKYVHRYRAEIQAMFEGGVSESGDKLGAGRMLEKLRSRYDGRFDLPSEAEIKAEISRLFAISKKRRASGQVNHAPAPKRTMMSQEHAQYLQSLVVSHPNVMPVAALESFRSQFPDSVSMLTDLQVRSKVTALKQKATSVPALV